MPMEVDVFDYVIVGAGAAGCILANRLAADGSKTVCLLEAGPADRKIFLHIPAGVYKTSSYPKFVWSFETVPSPGTANRSIPLPQGRTLGGSTAINGMIYNRGAAADFDEWAEQGNRGWGYADVLPYFKRTERRLGECDSFYRGREGLLPITDCDWRHPLCEAFIEAAMNAGVPHNSDYNAADQAGVGYYQRYIERGWRVSAARAFLRPLAKRKNLDIRTNAQATAVLFEGKRAIGVRYARGPGLPPNTVKARREVVVSAGAANSPKLLQLSGIGAESILSGLGIPLVHDLPGVGESVQDHYAVHLIARVEGIQTVSRHGFALLREAAKWMLGRPNFLAVSPSLVYAFVNSRDLHSTPDIQLDVALGNYADHRGRFPVIKLGYYQLRPKSIGYVRAVSADPFQAPLIQPNYLADDRDRQVVVDGMKLAQQLLRAPALRRFNCTEVFPDPGIADDADRLQFAREVGLTSYHLCGSCRMGPSDRADSVVDDQLRVHGLQGLRVVDASIMPAVPSANTSAAVFMIAEKAADMILGRQSLPALRERVAERAAAE